MKITVIISIMVIRCCDCSPNSSCSGYVYDDHFVSLMFVSKGIRLMIYILHYLKDPKLWELWFIPYYGKCRICIINRIGEPRNLRSFGRWLGDFGFPRCPDSDALCCSYKTLNRRDMLPTSVVSLFRPRTACLAWIVRVWAPKPY